MDQGKLVRRSKVPKDNRGNFWHWKDLNIGKDIAFFGVVYHTVDCDLFTKVRQQFLSPFINMLFNFIFFN